MDTDFTQFNFASQEHPTSVKFNNILSMLETNFELVEQNRWLTGPINIAQATSGTVTATQYYIQLIDDPNNVGGITIGPKTRAGFTVFYNSRSDDPTDRTNNAIFQHIHFTSGGSDWNYEWYALLGTSTLASGTLGLGGVDLSAVSISGFTCMRQPYTTGYK